MSDLAKSYTNNTGFKREGYINYKELTIHLARVKFYNPEPDKKFGFVTLLDENREPVKDAYLSGGILEKAGIYKLQADDLVEVRYVKKDKGDAVVYIRRFDSYPQPETANGASNDTEPLTDDNDDHSN